MNKAIKALKESLATFDAPPRDRLRRVITIPSEVVPHLLRLESVKACPQWAEMIDTKSRHLTRVKIPAETGRTLLSEMTAGTSPTGKVAKNG